MRAFFFGTIAGVATLLGGCARDNPSVEPGEPGMTYASLQDLPDLGGWWLWEYSDDDVPPMGSPPNPFLHAPLKPEVLSAINEFNARAAKVFDTTKAERPDESALGVAPPNLCGPPRPFLGFNGGFENYFEVLLTPGRVTIADDFGGVRRIMLNRQLPADVEESYAGTSVARWEGSTLVVETTGLYGGQFPDVPFPLQWGKGAQLTERMWLKEPDLLQIDMRLVAPGAFTAPFERSFVYRRDRDREFVDGRACGRPDRSIDPDTGRQRFDMTPPADLPPPPTG